MGKKKISGYENHFQHIEDMAERVSAILEVRMLENELKSLGDGEADRKASIGKKLSVSRRKLTMATRKLEKRVGDTLDRGEVELPFCKLCSSAGLSPLETRILELLLCARAHDEIYERACELSDTRTIMLKTILNVLGGDLDERAELRKVLGPRNPLFSRGLAVVENANKAGSEADFRNIRLYISCRTYSLLMGLEEVSILLEAYSEMISDFVHLEELILPEELKQNLLTLINSRELHGSVWKDWGLEALRQFSKGTVLALSGPEGSGRRTLALSLAGEMGMKSLFVKMDKILNDSDSPVNVCRLIVPEAESLGLLPIVTDADHLFSKRNSAELEVFRNALMDHDGLSIITVGEDVNSSEHLDGCVVWNVTVPMPDRSEREKIWRRLLPDSVPLADDVDISRLALEHEMTAGAIREAIVGASLRALTNGRLTEGIRQDELEESCRSCVSSDRRKSGRQRRMRVSLHPLDEDVTDGQEGYFDTEWSRISMKDVVLPSRTRRQVMDIISAAHHQEQVFEEWGFEKVAGSGHSISALFKGESGTGKTMTAEAVAYELGRRLCTVRGSSVISKWVGESEKNIVRIFREAEDKEVIFFDEADSIFTSRIEQDDSHAEMINRRISCLLREIELFKGVIILATNYPGLIDNAFQRRIRFKVDFPRPDRKAREAIWRANLPGKVPLDDDVDLAFLAEEFDFTGGQIRSILLRAAFAAAGRGRGIDRELIIQAAEDEVPFVARKEIGFSYHEEHS